MKAEIITIGTEILIGSILNTNSKYLSLKLAELGVHTEYQISVRDDYDILENQIKESIERSDLIFLCGGLGPTADDMTKDALAKVINKEIIIDEKEKEHLMNFFNKVNRKMTDNNLRQARVLKGSKILHNYWGIAPGEVIELNNKKIFLLPGPPKEFQPMVDKYLYENIVEENNIIIKSLNVTGIGEAATEDRIRKLNLENEEISINTFAHFSDTEIKIIGESNNLKNIKDLEDNINKIVNILYNEFGNNVYSEENISIQEALVKVLINKNIKISFAESITGGLVASKITSIAGASNILKASYVTYSNEAKIYELNVSSDTLSKCGAVSKETAFEMAQGLYKKGFCDIAVSVTGEAGPKPSEKEVGKTFICFYYGFDNYEIKECDFSGNRNEIQERAANYIISHLLLKVK